MRGLAEVAALTVPDREPLSGVDNAWRRMGTADNLTTITGLLRFDEPISYEALRDRLAERLLRFDRFRQRVDGQRRQLRQPYWETAEDVDVDTHLTHVSLPEPQDESTLQEFLGTLMSRPLDERRPLWEAYLIEDGDDGEGNALVVRINHSVGDGFALLYVLFGLVDDPEAIEMPMGIVPDPPSPDEFRDAPASANGGAQTETTTDSTVEPTATEGPSDAATDNESTDDSGLSLGGGSLLDALGLGARGVRTGWELLTQDDEVDTSLRGDLGTAKRVGWTDEIPLETVKDIGEDVDGTVNDVLMGALAGAFRRLLEARGEPVDGRELRVTVPVNLKSMDERDASLGNHFGLVFVPLPVGTPELTERIRIIHDRMDEQRAGIEAYLMYLTLTVGGRAPDRVQEWLMAQFEDLATGVVTNVPGPLESVELVGREVTDVMFWVPQGNDQGLGVSIFSYDGRVRLGIAADANLLDEPERLADAFEAEIAALLADAE